MFSYSENFKSLEHQIISFQGLKFPKLALPSLNKPKKQHKKQKQKSCRVSPSKDPDSIYTFRASPLPNLHLPTIAKVSLGPGHYSSISRDESKVFISNTGRCESRFEDQISLFLSKSRIADNSDKDFFKINKDLQIFAPHAKEIVDKEREKLKEIQLKIKRRTKSLLDENDKKVKEEKYLEKLEKVLWKRKISEFKDLALLCFAVIARLGLASVFVNKLRSLKNLRKRSIRVLGILAFCCVFLGKVRRFLHKRRFNCLVKVIEKNFDRMKDWLSRLKKRYGGIVNDCIEKPMLSFHLFELMAEFMRKSLRIQRNIRSFLRVKSARLAVIVQKFQKLAEVKGFYRSSSIKSTGLKKNYGIPEAFILEYAEKYYKYKIFKFVNDRKKYLVEKELAEIEYQEKIQELFMEIFVSERNVKVVKRKVLKPVFLLYSDKESIERFIEKGRKQWMRLLKVNRGKRKSIERFKTNLY